MSTFREVIETPEVQEVHYQPKRTYLPIIGEHGAFQCDLMFLDQFSRQNRGYNAILSVVNIPSRFGYAVPVKGKDDTLRAFKAFVVEARKNGQDIVRLESDNGSEFVNRAFAAYLKKEGIAHTTANPGDHRKNGLIERFNQSLRGWIEKWLTEKQVNNWIDVMPQILEYYNTRKHKTTGVAPASMTEDDEDDLIHSQYEATQGARDQINAIKPGDRVRVILHKKAFGKGRLRWSDSVYTIDHRVPNSYTFKLRETEVPQKYSDIQLVSESSRDIKPKAAATVALAERRQHALRLGRSGLARGPREAEALIEQVNAREAEEPAPQAPPKGASGTLGGAVAQATRRPSTRERRAPAYLTDYVRG